VPAALFHKKPALAGVALLSLLSIEAARADVPTPFDGVSFGAALALTSNYIYRGVSQSDGHGAVQADAHLATAGGSFLGVWASSRDSDLEPGADALVDVYLGHHFELSTAWSLTARGRARYYVNASDYEPSADYQELSLAVGYLDRWSLGVTWIPSAVRYWVYQRIGRAPAWVADTSAQWLLVEHLYLTAGAGYYRSEGTGPGIERATGYAYGNAGAAYERGRWRLDVGYFITQDAAARSVPYPSGNGKVAATLSWRF
jgi:uncharacterized protein (TIGR02001 family)